MINCLFALNNFSHLLLYNPIVLFGHIPYILLHQPVMIQTTYFVVILSEVSNRIAVFQPGKGSYSKEILTYDQYANLIHSAAVAYYNHFITKVCNIVFLHKITEDNEPSEKWEKSNFYLTFKARVKLLVLLLLSATLAFGIWYLDTSHTCGGSWYYYCLVASPSGFLFRSATTKTFGFGSVARENSPEPKPWLTFRLVSGDRNPNPKLEEHNIGLRQISCIHTIYSIIWL